MQIPDSANNAVLLKIDSTSCYNVGGSSSLPTGSWQWVNYNDGSSSNAISLSLTAGSHTFQFVGTYAGVEVDRVLAVPGISCTPTGTGDNCTTVMPPSTPSGVTAAATSSNSVTISWTASTDTGGPGLGGYYIYRGGTQVGTASAAATSYVDNTVSPATLYSYTLKAYDTLSNLSAASSAAMVTTPNSAQAPTVSLTALPNNTKLTGSAYSVSASATPASGNTVSQVQLLMGATVVQTFTTAPYTFSLNTLSYRDGSYTLTVKATDNHGNVGTAVSTVLITNGDFNNDNKVSISDLSILAANWNKQSGATYSQGDLNGDGKVTIGDLSILANSWNATW